MATDIKEYFSKFFDWNNDPQRFEVYSVLEEATNGFQRGRCEALLYDLRQMVEDWKYQKLCDSIDFENDKRVGELQQALIDYEIATNDEYPYPSSEIERRYEKYQRIDREFVRLPYPPPGTDTSTIPTPPIFDYAFSLLCRDGEEPPRIAASTPTAPATGQDDEAATPTPVQLPPELQTDEAKKWLEIAVSGGLLDSYYQPTDKVTTLPQKAILAELLYKKIGLKYKWKCFQILWNVKGLAKKRYRSKNETGYVPGEKAIFSVFGE